MEAAQEITMSTLAEALENDIIKGRLTEAQAAAIALAVAVTVRHDVGADEIAEWPETQEPQRFDSVLRFSDGSELAVWAGPSGETLVREADAAAESYAAEAWQWEGLGVDGLPCV